MKIVILESLFGFLSLKINTLTLKGRGPHAQGSHQNALIIGPIGAFFVSRVNNEVIHQTLLVGLSVLQGLNVPFHSST